MPSSSMAPLLAPLRRPVGSSPVWARASARRGLEATGRFRGLKQRQNAPDKTVSRSDRKEMAAADLTMSKLKWFSEVGMMQQGNTPLIPGTFVSFPLSRYPRNPIDFLRYQWLRSYQSVQQLLTILMIKLESMPDWKTWPFWRANRRNIAPIANIRYREMLEAVAQGNKGNVHIVCVPSLADKFCAAIDRRNPKEKVLFQLLKYNQPWFYPKLVSYLISKPDPQERNKLYEQAVVAISSLQKLSRYDPQTGITIPGTVKVQNKVEYLVMTRETPENGGWTNGRWRIWGVTTPTTLEDYEREQKAITKHFAEEEGWK